MRDLHQLDQYRIRGHAAHNVYGWDGDGTCGCFTMTSPTDHQPLVIVASSEGGWDHVSVSCKNRCPNWIEMDYVKRSFFRDDETAMQLHVPPSAHINVHPNCLHLWAPNDGTKIPLPPPIFV